MPNEQQLNFGELNIIQGLCKYLSAQNGDLSFDVTVTDSNGEKVGEVRWAEANDYQFYYPAPS